MEYLDIVFRTVVVYLALVGGILFFGRKELAQLSVTDLVFILLISNAVQNAMVGPSVSLSGGLVAALTLFVVNNFFKWLMYNFRPLAQLFRGQPIVLVYRGILRANGLAQARLTEDELMIAIREHGADEISKVQLAMFETDGNISVVTWDNRTSHTREKKPPKLDHG